MKKVKIEWDNLWQRWKVVTTDNAMTTSSGQWSVVYEDALFHHGNCDVICKAFKDVGYEDVTNYPEITKVLKSHHEAENKQT